jgi:hypothetical protein
MQGGLIRFPVLEVLRFTAYSSGLRLLSGIKGQAQLCVEGIASNDDFHTACDGICR